MKSGMVILKFMEVGTRRTNNFGSKGAFDMILAKLIQALVN